jgi:DNA modification methylase
VAEMMGERDLPVAKGLTPYASGRGWAIYCADARDIVHRLPPADVVLSSPPYLDQRTYGRADTETWGAIVIPIYLRVPVVPDGQILVNLGLVRRKSVVRYWDPLIAAMDSAGRELADWLVWDQRTPMPGDFRGRLLPQHEWILHFRSGKRAVSKNIPTLNGTSRHRIRARDGSMSSSHDSRVPVQPFRAQGSVLSASRCTSNTERTGHHAQMSLAVARLALAPWPDMRLVCDPMCGSGTTGVAALEMGAAFVGVDIDPASCEIAAKRLRAAEAEQEPAE